MTRGPPSLEAKSICVDWFRPYGRPGGWLSAGLSSPSRLKRRDRSYALLLRDLMRSAVDQLDAQLVRVGPALAHTVDDVKGGVDLGPFRTRFAGTDRDLGAAFDEMAAKLVQVAFREASLR